jgi:hypothetical protein
VLVMRRFTWGVIPFQTRKTLLHVGQPTSEMIAIGSRSLQRPPNPGDVHLGFTKLVTEPLRPTSLVVEPLLHSR